MHVHDSEPLLDCCYAANVAGEYSLREGVDDGEEKRLGVGGGVGDFSLGMEWWGGRGYGVLLLDALLLGVFLLGDLLWDVLFGVFYLACFIWGILFGVFYLTGGKVLESKGSSEVLEGYKSVVQGSIDL